MAVYSESHSDSTMTDHRTYDAYLLELNQQIEGSIQDATERRLLPREHCESVVATALRTNLRGTLETLIQEVLVEPSADDVVDYAAITLEGLTYPPQNAAINWKPDYALPMFPLARPAQRNPASIAQQFAETISSGSLYERVEATGPYVNKRLSEKVLSQGVADIIAKGERYGQLTDHQGEVAVIDYSGPNVAKPFGINHLRSTVIGEALSRLLDANGYTVIRDNHLGDWGTQFGNLLAAFDTYSTSTDFNSLTIDDLNKLYVQFSEDKKTTPSLIRKGQSYFSRLEAGDPELMDRWTATLRKSMHEFSAMYQRLGIHFDTQIGEGYFVQSAKDIIGSLPNRLPGKVIHDTDTDAVYINAEYPIMLKTSDGYCVYAARDLATIQFRSKRYNPNVMLYVVGEEQSTSFDAVFTVAQEAELTDTRLEHISFGLLLDENGKKLSTRKGTSGKLEDVLDAVEERAFEEVTLRNKNMSPDEARQIARDIAVGALVWNDLRADRRSSVRFDINRMLTLGGGSVVDILYTYSRTASLLEKIGAQTYTNLIKSHATFSSDTEHRLAARMMELGNVVRKAADDRAPHVLVGYLQNLATLHGKFYEESRVIGVEDEGIVSTRIALHKAYEIVVNNTLRLLNIPVVKRI